MQRKTLKYQGHPVLKDIPNRSRRRTPESSEVSFVPGLDTRVDSEVTPSYVKVLVHHQQT